MKKFLVVVAITLFASTALAQQPKSKFYDFGEQVIDGEIKKPTALYTDSKNKVKFDRLLKLKKSFISSLNESSKERTFKQYHLKIPTIYNMEPKRFFQSNLLKALIFFCFGFVVLEPMDTALWILSGVFISLAFFESTDLLGQEAR